MKQKNRIISTILLAASLSVAVYAEECSECTHNIQTDKPKQPVPLSSDIQILPKTANDAPIQIKLRKPIAAPIKKTETKPYSKNKLPIRQIPKTTVSPVQTKKQILEKEIRQEQTALNRTQAQLNSAKAKGENSKIHNLLKIIEDRKANINAIQRELSSWR